MGSLADFSLGALFILGAVALLSAAEIGRFLGVRDAGEADVSTLEASVLGLLALMLGFTFSMALARYDERREGVLLEANAIGTAALRASLLPAPHDADSLRLLQDYVQVRVGLTKSLPAPAELVAAVARSNALQNALWKEARGVMAKDNAMAPTGLFIQALNDMFDNQEKRMTAARTRVPDIVVLSLYGFSVVAIGLAAYASGLERRKWRAPVYVTALLVADVIVLIQDIDRPSAGFVAVSQQPMLDAAASVADLANEAEKRAVENAAHAGGGDSLREGAGAHPATRKISR
jgi:hypothetical protein